MGFPTSPAHILSTEPPGMAKKNAPRSATAAWAACTTICAGILDTPVLATMRKAHKEHKDHAPAHWTACTTICTTKPDTILSAIAAFVYNDRRR